MRRIDPGLDFSDIPALREMYERYTGMKVHERHPYAGDLVFTAFSGLPSGRHQYGRPVHERVGREVPGRYPYLPIDPADIGRQYEPIIRINSQSGRGGAAFIMQNQLRLA